MCQSGESDAADRVVESRVGSEGIDTRVAPQAADGFEAIVGPYLNLPEHALVLQD